MLPLSEKQQNKTITRVLHLDTNIFQGLIFGDVKEQKYWDWKMSQAFQKWFWSWLEQHGNVLSRVLL